VPPVSAPPESHVCKAPAQQDLPGRAPRGLRARVGRGIPRALSGAESTSNRDWARHGAAPRHRAGTPGPAKPTVPTPPQPTGRTPRHQEGSAVVICPVPEPQHAVTCGEHLFLPLLLPIPLSSFPSPCLLGDAFTAAPITTASERTAGRQQAPEGLIFFLTLPFCFCISIIFVPRGCEATKTVAAGSEQGRELLLQAHAFL